MLFSLPTTRRLRKRFFGTYDLPGKFKWGDTTIPDSLKSDWAVVNGHYTVAPGSSPTAAIDRLFQNQSGTTLLGCNNMAQLRIIEGNYNYLRDQAENSLLDGDIDGAMAALDGVDWMDQQIGHNSFPNSDFLAKQEKAGARILWKSSPWEPMCT